MKDLLIYLLLLFIAVFSSGCKDSVVTGSNGTNNFKEIISTDFSGFNVKMYLLNSDTLTTGYNQVFFKVNKNGAQQNSGIIKFYSKMQMAPHLWHGTPVCSTYTYDNTSGYYTGYIIFTMSSQPPVLQWKSLITYADAVGTAYISDTIITQVVYHEEKQWKLFEDTTNMTKYFLALVEPFSPAKGSNNFSVVLNKSDDIETEFGQVSDAQMFVKVYKADSLNVTSGNQQPVSGSDGVYRGRINLPYTGSWKVCDTIFYNNHFITNNPPPMPEFTFEVK